MHHVWSSCISNCVHMHIIIILLQRNNLHTGLNYNIETLRVTPPPSRWTSKSNRCNCNCNCSRRNGVTTAPGSRPCWTNRCRWPRRHRPAARYRGRPASPVTRPAGTITSTTARARPRPPAPDRSRTHLPTTSVRRQKLTTPLPPSRPLVPAARRTKRLLPRHRRHRCNCPALTTTGIPSSVSRCSIIITTIITIAFPSLRQIPPRPYRWPTCKTSRTPRPARTFRTVAITMPTVQKYVK